MTAPVEVTTRFATTVDDLPAAWAFVMERIDQVGADPSVKISPIWSWQAEAGSETSVRQFEVVVDGMVEEGTAA